MFMVRGKIPKLKETAASRIKAIIALAMVKVALEGGWETAQLLVVGLSQ
jgi:hypothetical protein